MNTYRPLKMVHTREHEGSYTVMHHAADLMTVKGSMRDLRTEATYAFDAIVKHINGRWVIYGGTFNNGHFWHEITSGLDTIQARCRLRTLILRTAGKEGRRAMIGRAMRRVFFVGR